MESKKVHNRRSEHIRTCCLEMALLLVDGYYCGGFNIVKTFCISNRTVVVLLLIQVMLLQASLWEKRN